MKKTNVHTEDSHPHSNTQTHMHGDSSTSSPGPGRSLLLVGGLELSSQVLPVNEGTTNYNSTILTKSPTENICQC